MAIILTAGSRSRRKVRIDFNREHGDHITHNTGAKLFKKVLRIKRVVDVHERPLTKAQPRWCWQTWSPLYGDFWDTLS